MTPEDLTHLTELHRSYNDLLDQHTKSIKDAAQDLANKHRIAHQSIYPGTDTKRYWGLPWFYRYDSVSVYFDDIGELKIEYSKHDGEGNWETVKLIDVTPDLLTEEGRIAIVAQWEQREIKEIADAETKKERDRIAKITALEAELQSLKNQ